MKMPTLSELDKTRKDGFRPSVVCCFINNGMVLFLYKADYHIWMLPQGGILNSEEPAAAAARVLEAEMGKDFFSKCTADYVLFGEDLVEFLPEKYDPDAMVTDTGEKVVMKGKKYFFYAIAVSDQDLELSKTEYQDYFWLDYKGGVNLAKKIHQSGKRRITSNVLNLLKEAGLVA